MRELPRATEIVTPFKKNQRRMHDCKVGPTVALLIALEKDKKKKDVMSAQDNLKAFKRARSLELFGE